MKVLTIFFTLAVARFKSVAVKGLRPKSDRLSNEKEKKALCFFPVCKRDYELKSQYLCELEKKREKIFLKSKETCEFAV